MTEMPILWCQGCGASTKVVSKRGHEQACRAGVPVVWTTVNPHKPASQAKPEAVTHNPITHLGVTHTGPANVTHGERSKGAERQARYRERHGATYRQKHRDLMRRRRATGRAA